ncbi:hypothetical protein SADUNF_Sadunf04G0155100 [Salix dunnii]|uniref:Dolichyl-diphosphooligosaccharide-protein glycosyltransferase subunit OST5 n=1 Tax=Salix dunnii TaxID=1413687 RepID=A0A835KC10_9ROSI|nr:hypothetical protein SADUNF_Sadunf04G0155100 [Salix dunnii]
MKAGVDLGLYLSPWDRHEVSCGKTLECSEFCLGQMTELLTSYGEIKDVLIQEESGTRMASPGLLVGLVSFGRYLQGGDPAGHDWVPAECDVSIRPGWFWHESEVPNYEATSSRRNRSLAKELTTGALASFFLGFGTLFLLLASGVYV